MNLTIGLQEGFREISAHKFRSFLTMFGVILGVASLLTMFALTEGMAREFRSTLQEVGGLEKVEIIDTAPPPNQTDIAELSPGRTYADVLALRKAPLIDLVSPQVRIDGGVGYRNKWTGGNLVGVEPDFLEMERHELAEGRFLTQLDVERTHRVCVIGQGIVDEIWEDPSDGVIGKTLNVAGESFRIVGLFRPYMSAEQERLKQQGVTKEQEKRNKARGSRRKGNRWDPFWNKNRAVVVPITTAQALFKTARMQNGLDQGPDMKLSLLSARIRDVRRFNTALDQIRNVLTLTHRGIQDFGFNTREDWFESIERGIRSSRISGGLIAGISLLVGGLGIANIMLASIAERVREIGIRRAIGAQAADVFLQIIVESTVLAALGGLLGIGAGFGLMDLVSKLNPTSQPPVVVPVAILISFGFALLTGVLAGIYPAMKASRLSPIQALRYE
jgi:putative ABC transport system permease protein